MHSNNSKDILLTISLLAKAIEGAELYMYLVVSRRVVSIILLREEGKQQQPIYYISKTMVSVETRYTHMEKIVLALVIATKK